MHISMRVLKRGMGRGTAGSADNPEQLQPSCRGAVPGDVVLQVVGYHGGVGELSCFLLLSGKLKTVLAKVRRSLKHNLMISRHWCHQEQARGNVSQNIRQNQVQLYLLASFLQVQKMAEGMLVRTQPRKLPCILCQQPTQSSGACCGFPRHTTKPVSPWTSEFGFCEVPITCSSSAQGRCAQDSPYPPAQVLATAWWQSLWLCSVCQTAALDVSSYVGCHGGSRLGQGPSKPSQHINCKGKW